jgi:CubicO group peptidase (beta-lactamase class C family)
MTLRSTVIAIVLALTACASQRPPSSPAPSTLDRRDQSASFSLSTPEREGVDANALSDLTTWVRDSSVPIFSILISRNGKLIYELYTSNLTRDDAHYLMSVTKSFTSALVGIAIDSHMLPSADASIVDALPATIFASESDRDRFRSVTMRDVLAMSALDAQVPPHLITEETKARQREFLKARNRAKFALNQALLAEPGRSFQYTDITPLLATGAIEYATKMRAFDFAEAHLFRPLAFRNEEWMHEDEAGIDNGAYGLRLRPIDMQKFGILYMDGGAWNGVQIISKDWVDKSLAPWIRSRPKLLDPNYGWYWWQHMFGTWVAHVATGWKGQRIAIVPSEHVVVTMTASIEKGEDAVFARVMQFVRDAVKPAPLLPSPDADQRLGATLAEAHASSRIANGLETRMVPSIHAKEKHWPFAGK